VADDVGAGQCPTEVVQRNVAQPDAGDEACRWHLAAIEAVRRQRRQFEERGAGVDQQVDALARQHFAARRMPCAGGFAAAAGNLLELVVKVGDEAAHHLGVAGKIGRCRIDRGMKRHGLSFLWVTG